MTGQYVKGRNLDVPVCGRYGSIKSTAALAERFVAAPVSDAEDWPPSWNVAPTQDVRAVIERPDQGRLLVPLRWGLVPYWAKDPSIGSRQINARAETVAKAPAFRNALVRHRCLIPADGFYEWRRIDDGTKRGKRQPFWFTRADGDVMALAGLRETWKNAEGRLLRTCTIVTTASNHDVRDVHDRMPVILEPADWDGWLDPEQRDADAVRSLLVTSPDGTLVRHAVSDRVNRPEQDDAGLVEPVEEIDSSAPPMLL